MRHGGWYPRRRGILDHLENGDISLLDAAVHDFLCLIADYRTGVARASAEKIRALCPADVTLRAIQRSLEKLEKLGWIKRFREHGKKGNYAIVIRHYFVRDASLKWWRVNAERTTDWRDIQLDPVTDPSFVADSRVTDGDTDVSSVKELRTEKPDESNKLTAAVDSVTDKLCAHEEPNPWKFTGVVFEKLPRNFREKWFDDLVRIQFAGYREDSHDAETGECCCSAAVFLDLLRSFLTDSNCGYPPALLKRQIECERVEHHASALSEWKCSRASTRWRKFSDRRNEKTQSRTGTSSVATVRLGRSSAP